MKLKRFFSHKSTSGAWKLQVGDIELRVLRVSGDWALAIGLNYKGLLSWMQENHLTCPFPTRRAVVEAVKEVVKTSPPPTQL